MIADAGVESVKLPPRSPNLNAYAERFVRSIKESCLKRMIFFGEESLRTATSSLIMTTSAIIKVWRINSSAQKRVTSEARERSSAGSA